jgi:uncharacterized membrane protein YkvA (DUF1232 family)
MKEKLRKYRRFFSESGFWQKISGAASRVGQRSVYTALLMFYAFRRKETPLWAKNIILGTLGYLLAPIDAIPDMTPLLGYTDDLGVLAFGLVAVASYVDEEVREKARGEMGRWFGELHLETLEEVDKKL